MKAKDTVMMDCEIQSILDRVANKEKKSESEVRRQVAKAQAEITGKIMYQAGIKAVVEFVEENNTVAEENPIYSPALYPEVWEAKLKEWGI